jgi:hypothetical protein
VTVFDSVVSRVYELDTAAAGERRLAANQPPVRSRASRRT